MSRRPVVLTADIADHLDQLMRAESATGGVERGWLLPMVVPITEVLDGRRWANVRTGVYVPCDHDFTVRYVGSIHRTDPALATRLREHFAKHPEREGTWTRMALIALPNALTTAALRRCEGRAGRALDPLDNTRLPAVPGRPAWTPRAHAA
ncbi:hypothetical protein [Kitasatospora sp. NPDC088134]|uniref:hypothetical protein n=1 Tax=Kitasatospora sp. NPDC088134 TaxID=3364071 RepID=UPI0038017D96